MSINDDLRSSGEQIDWEESHTLVMKHATGKGFLNLTTLPPRKLNLKEPENGAKDPDFTFVPNNVLSLKGKLDAVLPLAGNGNILNASLLPLKNCFFSNDSVDVMFDNGSSWCVILIQHELSRR